MMNLPLSGNRFQKLARSPFQELTPGSPQKNHGAQKHTALPLSEFLKPLVQAMNESQPWVADFANDQILLPADLYEVISEFTRLSNRPGQQSDGLDSPS